MRECIYVAEHVREWRVTHERIDSQTKRWPAIHCVSARISMYVSGVCRALKNGNQEQTNIMNV